MLVSQNSLSVSFAQTIKQTYQNFQWHYDHSFVVRGVELVGHEKGIQEFVDYGRAYVDAFVTAEGTIKSFDEGEYNLDQVNPGRNVFRSFRATKAAKYRQAIERLREQLRHQPRTPSGGFWHKKIYPNQMWLDGLFMAAPFYAEYAETFGEAAAFDDLALQVRLFQTKARDPKSGLLYHAWDEGREQRWANKETGCSPNFWGRAMGWYVMSLIDILDHFPTSHPAHPELVSALTLALDALARVQDVSGMWWQILDLGGRPGNYLEASCTAMFIYALAKGVRLGYLPKAPYLGIARQAFAGLGKSHVATMADGKVILQGICAVAGLGVYKPDMDYRDGSYAYYIGEKVVPNDFKGAGAFLLACLEMERVG